MESPGIEKLKGYYGCGYAADGDGCGSADAAGDGSGDSDGHGRNYTQDLNQDEIFETGYGRGIGQGGGGGGDSHGQIFNADLIDWDLIKGRAVFRADYYEGDGQGYGYGTYERYCGSLDADGGEGFGKPINKKNRYDVGDNSGSGSVDGRGADYPRNRANDFSESLSEKKSFLGWLRRISRL